MIEIPDEALEAAGKALADKYDTDESHPPGQAWRNIAHSDAATAVAAALPSIEAAVRAKVAAEIEALDWRLLDEESMPLAATTNEWVRSSYALAARVARGGEAAT